MTTINSGMSKLIEMFKNLKSDAMPQPPRPVINNQQEPNGNSNVPRDTEDHEEIIIEPNNEPNDIKKEKKKQKKSFFKSKKVDDYDDFGTVGNDNDTTTSSVHVQATGNVYNIVNSKDVRLGNDYFFGPVTMPTKNANKEKKYQDEDEIEKDNLIKLLMEAKIRPDHDFMDYISKNLGKNWHSIFRSLGFTQGRIETAEINAQGYDISEARYKLLLDWVNNDDDGTIGHLTTLLWEEGERSIVKQLSTMYKKMKK